MKKIFTLIISLFSGLGLLLALWNSVLADPTLVNNNGMIVNIGTSGNTILSSTLQVTDTLPTNQITYTIDTFPAHGILKLVSTPLTVTGLYTFTQSDIDNNLVKYDQNGSTPPTTDSFVFTVQHDTAPIQNQSFDIIINQPPVANPDTIRVLEGGTVINTTDNGETVAINDIDPNGGTLTVTTTPITAPTHFTNTFLLGHSGSFTYEHDGSENLTDEFVYEICDDGPTPLCDEATATIIITGVVDITPTLSATGPFTIPENIVDGGSVGTVTALDEEVDPGTYDTLTFSITTVEPPTNVFKINNSTGLITVTNNGEIDFETIDTYTLTVQVQDSGGFTDIEQVIVNISNIDEKPTVPGGQEFFVNENSTVFTSSNQVIATDPENDIVDYSITDPTDDLFFINNGSGELSVNILKADLLDFETLDTYVLTIEVSDAQGLTNANNITIKLNDINEPPIFNNFTTNIDENRPNGFSLSPFPYNISILKDPEGDDLDFKIVGGSGATAFSINENSGQITVGDATQLNFENTQSFSLIVEAKEASGTDLFSDTATITIDINNINEAPVINPNQAFNIPENSPNNTIVDTVIVDDEDEADDIGNLNFAITNGNASSTFSIDNNGVIKVTNNSELDHEQNPSFTLEITVTDSNWDGQGTKQDVETITINLNDINESPVFNDFQTSINENRPNGFSLSPFPYDNTILMDPELDDLDFQIIGGTGSTAFTINENSGQIMVNDSTQLNYEDTQSFSLIVEAKEATGTDLFSDSSTITIDINNINEAPVINPNQLFNIQENSANNTRVDTVVFNDEDTADIGNLIFAITDGDSSGTFSIDNNGEIKVANNSALDFEQIQSFNLEITVTDSNWDSQGPKQDVETIIINVDNQNEQPTINSGQSFTIEGFSTNGTEVGTVIASDPDFGDTFEYEIIGGDDKGAFKIDSITGKITVNKRDELDFDKIQVFTLAVQVTDRLGKKSTNDVIINLTKPSTYFTFVPLLLNNYRVDEPNDNCAQAYGISTNQSLWFLPEDGEDWYKFTLTSSKSVEVVLSNYQAEGQIIAYQGSCGNLGNPPIGHNGDFSSTKTMNLGTLSAGTYFIRVVTDPPYGSTPYNLIINAQ